MPHVSSRLVEVWPELSWKPVARVALGAAVWCGASPALAGDPIVVVGGPPVVADGQTTATIQFWSPAVAADAKISVNGAGEVGEATVDGGDFASVQVTPDAVTEAGELILKVKVGSSDGKGVGTLRVPVVPPDRGEIGVVFDPPMFRHGVDNAVSVRIAVPEGPRRAGSQSLEVHSNIGVIDTVTTEEDGKTFVARWRPPKDLSGSQMVLFAVVDTAAPDRVMGTAAYPVVVKKSLELPAPAGTSAVLTVGERQFGPLPTGPDGRVRFDVERDPRVSVGRLRIVAADGGVTESDVELAFGEGPRFTFVPPPPGALADAKKSVQVTVVAVNPDGSPWTKKAPEVKVDRGSGSGVVAASKAGRFVVTYMPDSSPGPVTFTATLDGQSVTRSMNLVAPADLAPRTGSFDPVVLDGTARDATFTVTGAAPGSVVVDGGAARGRSSGGGPYTQAVRLDGSASQMVARGGPAVSPTGRPVTQLFLWTSESTVQADAVSMVPFVVAAVDDQGQPVPGVAVDLAVAVGTGSLPERLTTGSDGLASGLYTVGNQVGPVTLTAHGGGVHTAAPVFLEGAGYTGAELKVSGDARTLAARSTWMEAVAVARSGRAFPAAQPAVAPMTGADVARLEAEKRAAEKAAKSGASPASATASSGGSSKPAASGGSDPFDGLGPAPADGMGQSRIRVGAHVGAMPRSYSGVGSGQGSLPGGETEFTTPGLNAPALDVRGLMWFGMFGADARVRYVSQPVALPFDNESAQLGGPELVAGGRVRKALKPGFTGQAGLGVHYQSLSAFVVENSNIVEASDNLAGLRLAAGATLDRGSWYLASELAGTFAPSPAVFQFDNVVGYSVTDTIAVEAVYTYTARSTDIEQGEAVIEVSEKLNGIFIGASYSFQ
jgi:hypothetical protein